jgi:ParB family chromosome partitioning protein
MSAPPKRGLGRGLGALLGDARAAAAPASMAEGIREIPIDRIRPNPHQPRKHFDAEGLSELQASITELGVLVPILVRERGDSYELIAGERRWRACAALQRSSIPAIVRRSDDRESLEVAIVENLQREDLNALEEAAGIADLIESHNFTQEQVAQRLGKSRPSVTNALRILTLSEPIKAMIAEGKVTAGHAKAILGAPENARLQLARRVASDGLSVRALERIVARLQSPPASGKAATRSISADDRDFEDRLRRRLGTRVALRRTQQGGTIEIKYSDESDLMRIAELLLESE